MEHKDQFEKLFGNYYIGKKPTPNANKYHVLHFEFSRIDTTNKDSTFQGFLKNVPIGVKELIKTYPLISESKIKGILSEKSPNKAKQPNDLN